MLKKILNDRSFKLSIILTFTFLGTGFAFLHFGLAEYSWLLFCLLPVILGISIGALPDVGWAYFGGSMALIIFLLCLLAGHLEGFLCVLMVLPLVVPLIFIGSIIIHLVHRYELLKSSDKLPVLMLPLLLFFFGAPIEHFFGEQFFNREKKQVITVKTEMIYPYTCEQVYEGIKSLDTLIAEKPFLMKIDLPIPNKCVLENEAVGGLRVCHFSGGTITERITKLEPGKVIEMDVIDYQLTGRKWLGFQKANYYFEKIGNDSCKMTRTTVYTSELGPRFYWQPLEKLGINQEHDYVFEALGNKLR